MYQKSKLHNGLQADCTTCTPPDPNKKKKRERKDYDKPKRVRAGTLEMVLRRQMAEEIGEDELSKDFRFQIMQHYGLIAPRIDRGITKPSWKSESEWKRQKQEFHTQTRGLIPVRQYGRTNERNPAPNNRSSLRKISGYTPYRKGAIQQRGKMVV